MEKLLRMALGDSSLDSSSSSESYSDYSDDSDYSDVNSDDDNFLNIDPHFDPIKKLLGIGRRDDSPSSESSVSCSSSPEDDHSDPAGSEDNDDKECTYCSVCDAKADMRCGRCNDEFYCGKDHQKKHWKVHKKYCFVKRQDMMDYDYVVKQDAKIFMLPDELIWIICKSLGVRDLISLGQVCKHFRSVTRDPNAWSNAKFPCYKSERIHKYFDSKKCYQVLRFVPALHSLDLSYCWPSSGLMRCPKKVQVFKLDCDLNAPMGEPYDWKKVGLLLKHFKGSLREVHLGYLHDEELLSIIDSLGIHELYVSGVLLKTYPGSRKVITEITIGKEVKGEILAKVLQSCRSTLKTFKVDHFFLDKNPWAHYRLSPVRHALKKCTGLENASITTWGKITLLNSFPSLQKLCIHEIGDDHHKSCKDFFLSSPVMNNLERLTLQLGYQGHRGLIAAAASGCHSLKELRLMYSSIDKMNLTVTVDVPRDLHVILSSLSELKILMLSVARIPHTVFKGLANGALPNLCKLHLKRCGGTKKAMDAFKLLQSTRKDLQIIGNRLQIARRQMAFDPINSCVIPAWKAPPAGSRCDDPLCAAESDCDEQDPVKDPGPKFGKFKSSPFPDFASLGDGSDPDF